MIKCEVIRDLLPLYHDKVTSVESAALVEEHIKTCASCRAILETMQANGITPHIEIDCVEIGAFRKMKSKLRKKSIAMIVAAVLVTTVLLCGASVVPFSIPYDAEKTSVNLAYDQVIDIFYDGNYAGVNARTEGDTLYIGYYGTVYTAYQTRRTAAV